MDKHEQDERLTQSFSELKHCGNNYHARKATKKLPDISRFNADNGTVFLKKLQFICKRATHTEKSNQPTRNTILAIHCTKNEVFH